MIDVITIEPRADRRPVPSPRALRAIDTALRLHVPQEPTPETLEAIARAIDVPGCTLYEQRRWDWALAAYRAQPIWQALWGEK